MPIEPASPVPAVPPADPPVTPSAPSSTATTAPQARNSESIRAQIEQLGAQQDDAYVKAGMKRAAALNKEIREHLLSLIQTERQELMHELAHQQRMAQLYPDVIKEGTPLRNEVQRLYNEYEAAKDPILSRPDWPTRLTLEGARNIGSSIAPAS